MNTERNCPRHANWCHHVHLRCGMLTEERRIKLWWKLFQIYFRNKQNVVKVAVLWSKFLVTKIWLLRLQFAIPVRSVYASLRFIMQALERSLFIKSSIKKIHSDRKLMQIYYYHPDDNHKIKRTKKLTRKVKLLALKLFSYHKRSKNIFIKLTHF